MEIDVKHIARLARLKLDDAEVQAMKSEMVAMVENLPELTDEGALLDLDNTMMLREDTVVASYPREEILQNAPETVDGCFLVPKTVE